LKGFPDKRFSDFSQKHLKTSLGGRFSDFSHYFPTGLLLIFFAFFIKVLLQSYDRQMLE
jgi:hypothetical protein